MARWGNKQPDLAMADFDQALKLKPDDVAALVARARLRLMGSENPAVISDLDAADRFAPLQADIRLQIGLLYVRTGRFAEAVAQYDKWILAHRGGSQDARHNPLARRPRNPSGHLERRPPAGVVQCDERGRCNVTTCAPRRPMLRGRESSSSYVKAGATF
jgi:hypothetical protein